MIENTKKILKKLINDVEKYNACIRRDLDSSCDVRFTYRSQRYAITITSNTLYFSIKKFLKDDDISVYGLGKSIEINLPEDDKYEILNLCQKLKRECEDYTSTMFKKFADEDDNESDDDLE